VNSTSSDTHPPNLEPPDRAAEQSTTTIDTLGGAVTRQTRRDSAARLAARIPRRTYLGSLLGYPGAWVGILVWMALPRKVGC